MSAHVKELLYDFASGEATQAERERVQTHLATCPSCTADLESIFSALAVLPRPVRPPSDERDKAFWTSFANEIEAKIRVAPSPRRSTLRDFREEALAFVSSNRGRLLAGAGSLALAMAAFMLFWQGPWSAPVSPQAAGPDPAYQTTNPVTGPVTGPGTGPSTDPMPGLVVQNASLRMNDYLKKSKILFVGIANMKTDGQAVDLRAERKQSRALIHEARYLRSQPLDARSAKLIGELERILIELANLEETRDLPDVELIRTGIRKENLLFKIRMTENLMQAGYTERNAR
jgi:hypothetical protein